MALPAPDGRLAAPPGGFRSLTTRLIVWTLVAVGAVYVVTVVVSNSLARRTAISAAEREAVNETEAAASRVEDVLHSIEERTLALGEALSVLAPAEEDADRLLRRFVEGNRDVHGGAIAWNPGPRGERRALYFHRGRDGSGRLEPADLASDSYRYWEREWFRDALAAGRPLWTEPYRDTGGGEAWMVTFAVPFGASGATPAGVATADVRLQRLDSIVGEIELGRRGFGLLVSRSGHVVAASKGDRVDHEATVLQQARPEARVWLEPILKKVQAGEPGFARVEREGRPFRLTYRPLQRAGWTLAALYPEDELLAGVSRLRAVQGLARAGRASLSSPSSWSSSPAGSPGRSRPSPRARGRSPAATSTRRCRRSSRATRWARSRARSTTCATRSRSTSATCRRRRRRRSASRASSGPPGASRPPCCRSRRRAAPARATSSGRPSSRRAPWAAISSTTSATARGSSSSSETCRARGSARRSSWRARRPSSRRRPPGKPIPGRSSPA